MSAALIAEARRSRLTEAMMEQGVDILVVYGNAWQSDYLRYATDYGILEGEGLAIVRRGGNTTLFLDSPLEAERAEVETPGIEIIYAPTMLGGGGSPRTGRQFPYRHFAKTVDAAASRVAFQRSGDRRPHCDDGPTADEEA